MMKMIIMKIIWKYEKIRCVRGKAEYKLVMRYCTNNYAGGKWLEAMELRKAGRLEQNDNFFLHPHASLVSTLFSQWSHGEGSHHADCGAINLEDDEAPQRREGKVFRANIPPGVTKWRNYKWEHLEGASEQFSACGHAVGRVKERRHALCLFVQKLAHNKHSANGTQCCCWYTVTPLKTSTQKAYGLPPMAF